jgi:hypothetical protein
MNSSHAFSHSRMIAPYRCHHLSASSYSAARAAVGVHRGADGPDVAFEGVPVPLEPEPEGVADQVDDAGLHGDLQPQATTAVHRPFSPSQTRKNTSRTPRFFMSSNTLIQNFAPSPPGPAHSPRMSLRPSSVTPIAA